jgi:opacity protein-like surface antigen
MKKILSVLLATAALSVAAQMPSQANEMKKNYVGGGATFFSGLTGFGVISRIGVADNISVRPSISILGSSNNITVYAYSVTATYDFNMPSGLTPYAGVGILGVGASNGTNSVTSPSTFIIEGGADYDISDSFTLNGNYKFNNGGALSLGAGYKF